jgi:NADH-quinone oxidoreductase subunit J
MDALFFWLLSFGMIVCGLAVVLGRNPVASALCFAFSIVFMAGLFVLLSAFFLAAVQILVTAGAVMVLFLFIIMLLNPETMEHAPRHRLWMACSLLLALGFVFLVARTLQDLPRGHLTLTSYPTPEEQRLAQSPDALAGGNTSGLVQSRDDHRDDTHQIGRLLFTRYVAPFEVTSLLILVATIGVIVLCKQDDKSVPRYRNDPSNHQPQRPFEKEPETVVTR